MDPKFFAPAGKEHYRLLEHLSNRYSNRTLIDIGTYDGLSALALSTNPANTVLSFDIVTKPGLPSKANIQYSTDNLMTPEGRTKWKDVLLSAPFIFLDIDPHEGTREYDFYLWLRENDYAGFVLCDDIWYFGAMVDNFWGKIPDAEKLDVTYKGHWSGTGVIRFHPGEAETCLDSFVDPHFNYGRSTLDMALEWHPTCEVARRIREEFYHVLHLELGDGIENYLTIGTPAYSLPLLKAQELLYESGAKARHALVDGVPNGCALFLLLISNPTLTLDCMCETPPPSIAYLNAQFQNRIRLGRTQDSYDLLHVDHVSPIERVSMWKPFLTPTASVVLAKWSRSRAQIDAAFASNQLIWVRATPTSLLAKNRRGPTDRPETSLPSVSSN